jgi:hypothetical protein
MVTEIDSVPSVTRLRDTYTGSGRETARSAIRPRGGRPPYCPSVHR